MSASDVVRRLDLPRARLEDLARVRALVGDACAAGGVAGEPRDSAVLAADEWCSNLILYGYGRDSPGPITVDVAVRRARSGDAADAGDVVVVTVADAARPFDPRSAQAPDLDSDSGSRRLGGLGLHLIRKVMDEVRYDHDTPVGNRMTLVKRLAPRHD